jgi:hypothetical protein
MRKFVVSATVLAGIMGAAGAFAQGPASPPGGMPGMTHQTPVQGGMCGPGGCGMGTPGQGTPMQGMMQGQGGTMMGGCPMMQRSAALEQRLRRLEERMGIPAPPAQPTPPAQPGSPG